MCALVCLFYYSFLFVSGGQERPGCCRRWPGTGSIPKLRSSRPDSGPTTTRCADTSLSSASPSAVSYSVSYIFRYALFIKGAVSRGEDSLDCGGLWKNPYRRGCTGTLLFSLSDLAWQFEFWNTVVQVPPQHALRSGFFGGWGAHELIKQKKGEERKMLKNSSDSFMIKCTRSGLFFWGSGSLDPKSRS